VIRRQLVRLLNPRYAWLPPDASPARILDVGAGVEDARIAKSQFPACRFEAVNIAEIDQGAATDFDAYHRCDLNDTDLSFLEDASYDYVISSHTIEHLADGRATVARLCGKVRPGGLLYLEWPSVESLRFPVRGLGLNFYDDETHVRTFALEEIAEIVRAAGIDIEFSGPRRMWSRLLVSPFLVVMHSLTRRKLVLYDWWDLTGFCYVVRGKRPAATVR
jgi:SAM-dependent methyltransferase